MFPDVDRVGQHTQQVHALLAVPPGAAPAVPTQVPQEGQAVSLLEISNDGAPLLLALGPCVQHGVGRRLVLVVGHGVHLLVLSLPRQHSAGHRPVTLKGGIVHSAVVRCHTGLAVTLEHHPLRLVAVRLHRGRVQQGADLRFLLGSWRLCSAQVLGVQREAAVSRIFCSVWWWGSLNILRQQFMDSLVQQLLAVARNTTVILRVIVNLILN